MHNIHNWKGVGATAAEAYAELRTRVRAADLGSPDISEKIIVIDAVAGETAGEALTRATAALPRRIGAWFAVAEDNGFRFIAYYDGDGANCDWYDEGDTRP